MPEIVYRDNRLVSMPIQNVLLLAFGAGYDKIRFGQVCKVIYRDQFGFILCVPASGKSDVLCPAIRVGAIEGREAVPLRFHDSFLQFFLISSVFNICDMRLLQHLGFAARPQ